MIRILSLNTEPRTAANKSTHREVLAELAVAQSDDEGTFVRVPTEAFAAGPVLIVAHDGTLEGVIREETTIREETSKLVREACRYLAKWVQRPGVEDAMDTPQEAA